MTAVEFLDGARDWFRAHGIRTIGRIVTDNGACYRADAFRNAIGASRHQRITPYTPRRNGKVERYNCILATEVLYARTWRSEQERTVALESWNRYYNYHRPHGAHEGQPPASATPQRVNKRPGFLHLAFNFTPLQPKPQKGPFWWDPSRLTQRLLTRTRTDA